MAVNRIALVSLHTSPLAEPGSGDAGGMNVYIVALGEALARLGLEVEIITRSTSNDQPELEYTAQGLPVRFLKAGPPRVVPKDELPAIIGRFQSALSELPRFDLVHSHYWLSGLAALPVAVMEGIPHVQTLHTVGAVKNASLAPDDRAEPEARLNGERLLVTKSALTIVSTPSERAALIQLYGAAPGSIDVIQPGVDTRMFTPRERSRRGDPDPYLLILGRIQPLKGHSLAFKALAAIPAARRPRLIVAGSPTPGHESYLEELRDLALGLGISGRVTFAGTQSRLRAAALLRGAALVLMPSHSETFGLVALEAAASGTPVIASRTTGLSTAVADGTSGVLIDDRDPRHWAAAIDRLLQHPARLRRLSTKAARFGARHSWDHTAKATLEAYRRADDRQADR